MKALWTPEMDVALRLLVANGASNMEAANSISTQFRAVSTNSIRFRCKRLGLPRESDRMKPVPVAPTPAPVDPVQAEQERQLRLRSLREENEMLRGVAAEKNLRQHLEAIVQRVVRRVPAVAFPPAQRRLLGSEVSQETVVQMFSDWHAGENVSLEATRGFNEYNDAILTERLDRVVQAHLGIKHRLEAGGLYQFERLVVGCNGDFVSGTIHELEKHSDHDNIVWAVYATAQRLAESLRHFAAEYSEVEVFCTSGNHGRLPDARRVQQKEPTRSWDTLVYLFAKEMLADQTNVRFHIPNSYSVAFDVYGWRFLQTHGHDVKSWNSIPWYGLNRLVGNINALEASRGMSIHYWLFAHFHNASSLPHASGESFVNGSLIGANEFAFNALGKADRPTQTMLMVHPTIGVTSRWPLFAEKMP
jgi:hypothetical protein